MIIRKEQFENYLYTLRIIKEYQSKTKLYEPHIFNIFILE